MVAPQNLQQCNAKLYMQGESESASHLSYIKTDSDAEQEEELCWVTKPQHGIYHRQIQEVADIRKS